MKAISSHNFVRRVLPVAAIAILVAAVGMDILISAPLPPLGKTDVTGTIGEARWMPEASLKGRSGFSGSLGRDRLIPARFTVTLRDYSGPPARQAWMMNGFTGVKITGTEDRDNPPPTLVVLVNSADRSYLQAGMKIRLVDYTVTGDEGGTWASCARAEIISNKPEATADTQKSAAIPRKFKARIGGVEGSSYRVELTDEVLIFSTSRGRKDGDPVRITPTPDKWREFRASLDSLNVWRWDADYMNRKAKDGTQWSLEIEYPGHSLKVTGSNSYPYDTGKANDKPEMTAAFKRYLAAVENLLGNRTFK